MSTKQIKPQTGINEQISNKINEPIPKYDNKSTSISEKFVYIIGFIGELFKFYGIGLATTFPMHVIFILAFIISSYWNIKRPNHLRTNINLKF